MLTVTDLDQASGFYQRVLGMRPATFDAGRRALEFGPRTELHRGAGLAAGVSDEGLSAGDWPA